MYLEGLAFEETLGFYNFSEHEVPEENRLSVKELCELEDMIDGYRCELCDHSIMDDDGELFIVQDEKTQSISIYCSHCEKEKTYYSSYFRALLIERRNNEDCCDFIGVLSEELGKIEDIKGDDVMLNTNSLFKGFDFGAIGKNDNVKVSHLGLSIKNSTGTYVSYDKSKEELVDVDFLDIDLEGMIYKMPVAHKDIKVSDIIIHNGTPMIVKSNTNNKVEVVDPVAGEIKTILPTKNMFGFNFYTKYVCLIDFSNIKADNDNPFGNLMPLMFLGKGQGNDSMKTMMLMSMMSGEDMGDMFSNPMMMMMLMGDGKMNDMLPMMMMMGNNPFAPTPKKKVEN